MVKYDHHRTEGDTYLRFNTPMTEGAPWRHIVRFAMPVLAGSLLQQLYNTVDAIVVGNFSGEASLSAVGTTGSFIFLSPCRS